MQALIGRVMQLTGRGAAQTEGLDHELERGSGGGPRVAQLCLALVVAAGLLVLADTIHDLVTGADSSGWFLLFVLTCASGVFNLKVPGVPVTLSVSEVFVFLQILLFGSPAAVLTVSGDGLLTSVLRRDQRIVRVLFNTAEPAVSVWLATRVYELAGGHVQFSRPPTALGELIAPTLLLCVVYFVANSGLTAVAVWSDTGRSPWAIWRRHFAWVSLNYFAGASMALLVLHDVREVSLDGVWAAAPLVVTVYVAFKAWIWRADAEHRHLSNLNRLYLATVESLSIAIDAKDLTTASHIRRVQALSVRLARAMGITTDADIRAIEAAALLHDVGKLAVPDYILSKPGGLTESEYAEIKRHPVVGANILASVDFPFPVVPIVRHHHENWDGSGYPDGLAGPDIPIGARILSVVDCFDALTSHRPYRPALSIEAALAIINERKGRMYDPAVVDAFSALPLTSLPAACAPLWDDAGSPAGETVPLRLAPPATETTDDTAGGAAPSLAGLCAVLEAFGSRLDFEQAAELLAYELRRLIPATLVVFFLIDADRTRLTVAHASGACAAHIKGVSVPYGRALSGWVAANGTTIVNADPALDFIGRPIDLTPRLHSALSVQLTAGSAVVGVVSAYTDRCDAFTPIDRQTVESSASAMAGVLGRLARPGDAGPSTLRPDVLDSGAQGVPAA